MESILRRCSGAGVCDYSGGCEKVRLSRCCVCPVGRADCEECLDAGQEVGRLPVR